MFFSPKFLTSSFFLACCVLLSACDSDSGNPLPPLEITPVFDNITPIPITTPVSNTDLQTGYLLDSAVSGVIYTRPDGFLGQTNSEGAFDYYFGDSIEFKIADVSLGSYQTSASTQNDIILGLGPIKITPLSLTADAANSDDHRVINKLIMLQTLDDDGDPQNGIHISEAVHQAIPEFTIDFSLATADFVNGEFADLIDHLNNSEAFSDNTPRLIRSTIDALRHFGDVNTLPLIVDPVTSTYTAWWRESNACDAIGKSTLTVKNKSVTFCPNVSGHDGCYDGVIRSNGDITFAQMTANNECAAHEPGSTLYDLLNCTGAQYTPLQASLRYTDDTVSGNYQASCNNAGLNDTQTVTAAFGKTQESGGLTSGGSALLYTYLSSIRDDIDNIVSAGSCNIDSDCAVMTLNESVNCSLPEYLAHPTSGIDSDALALKQHIFNQLKREITLNSSASGTTICFIAPAPDAICSNRVCQLQ